MGALREVSRSGHGCSAGLYYGSPVEPSAELRFDQAVVFAYGGLSMARAPSPAACLPECLQLARVPQVRIRALLAARAPRSVIARRVHASCARELSAWVQLVPPRAVPPCARARRPRQRYPFLFATRHRLPFPPTPRAIVGPTVIPLSQTHTQRSRLVDDQARGLQLATVTAWVAAWRVGRWRGGGSVGRISLLGEGGGVGGVRVSARAWRSSDAVLISGFVAWPCSAVLV